ncbi:MAG: hypothetical protein WC889_06515 [Myxococcota bacterium]
MRPWQSASAEQAAGTHSPRMQIGLAVSVHSLSLAQIFWHSLSLHIRAGSSLGQQSASASHPPPAWLQRAHLLKMLQ